MGQRISVNLEPKRAPTDMPPPFRYDTLGVGIVVEIVRPGFIGLTIGVSRPLPLGLPAADKFIFIP